MCACMCMCMSVQRNQKGVVGSAGAGITRICEVLVAGNGLWSSAAAASAPNHGTIFLSLESPLNSF